MNLAKLAIATLLAAKPATPEPLLKGITSISTKPKKTPKLKKSTEQPPKMPEPKKSTEPIPEPPEQREEPKKKAPPKMPDPPKPPKKKAPPKMPEPPKPPKIPEPPKERVDECVSDDRPQIVRDGKQFTFSLAGSNSQCVDDLHRLYQWGEFEKVDNFSECAEACVNNTPESLAFNDRFRGYDYDCSSGSCRCLYDEDTLNSSNSKDFDDINLDESGSGSIDGTTMSSSGNFCGKLEEEFFDGLEGVVTANA